MLCLINILVLFNSIFAAGIVMNYFCCWPFELQLINSMGVVSFLRANSSHVLKKVSIFHEAQKLIIVPTGAYCTCSTQNTILSWMIDLHYYILCT
jgi:hypothetical protein